MPLVGRRSAYGRTQAVGKGVTAEIVEYVRMQQKTRLWIHADTGATAEERLEKLFPTAPCGRARHIRFMKPKRIVTLDGATYADENVKPERLLRLGSTWRCTITRRFRRTVIQHL